MCLQKYGIEIFWCMGSKLLSSLADSPVDNNGGKFCCRDGICFWS